MTGKRPYILRKEAGSGFFFLFVATWILIIMFTSPELNELKSLVLLIMWFIATLLGMHKLV